LETGDLICFWKLEDEPLGIVIVIFDLFELQVEEALITTREGFLWLCRCLLRIGRWRRSISVGFVAQKRISREASAYRCSSDDPGSC
jgi:hypothetical protein